MNPFATAKKSHRERFKKSNTFIPEFVPPKLKRLVDNDDLEGGDDKSKAFPLNAFVRELFEKPMKDKVNVEKFNVNL